jgi:hypothetical protein
LSFTGTGKIDLGNNELDVTATVATVESYFKNAHLVTSAPGGVLGDIDLGSGQTKVLFTLAGDASLDRTVDVGDLGKLATNYGTTSGATWNQGDFDHNGTVDVGDLGALATSYGVTMAGGAAAGGQTEIMMARPTNVPADPFSSGMGITMDDDRPKLIDFL